MPAWALYVLITINGLCTGLSQGFVASLAGLFAKRSFYRGTVAYQLVGAGFGMALPTFIQVGYSGHKQSRCDICFLAANSVFSFPGLLHRLSSSPK